MPPSSQEGSGEILAAGRWGCNGAPLPWLLEFSSLWAFPWLSPRPSLRVGTPSPSHGLPGHSQDWGSEQEGPRSAPHNRPLRTLLTGARRAPGAVLERPGPALPEWLLHGTRGQQGAEDWGAPLHQAPDPLRTPGALGGGSPAPVRGPQGWAWEAGRQGGVTESLPSWLARALGTWRQKDMPAWDSGSGIPEVHGGAGGRLGTSACAGDMESPWDSGHKSNADPIPQGRPVTSPHVGRDGYSNDANLILTSLEAD